LEVEEPAFDVAEMDVEDLGPLAESIIGFLAK
jgi:hypothetical protein